MDRATAEKRCRDLAETSPERETHRWMPRRDADGGWSVAKVGLAPKDPNVKAEQRADEKPPTPEDPINLIERNIGRFYG